MQYVRKGIDVDLIVDGGYVLPKYTFLGPARIRPLPISYPRSASLLSMAGMARLEEVQSGLCTAA